MQLSNRLWLLIDRERQMLQKQRKTINGTEWAGLRMSMAVPITRKLWPMPIPEEHVDDTHTHTHTGRQTSQTTFTKPSAPNLTKIRFGMTIIKKR